MVIGWSSAVSAELSAQLESRKHRSQAPSHRAPLGIEHASWRESAAVSGVVAGAGAGITSSPEAGVSTWANACGRIVASAWEVPLPSNRNADSGRSDLAPPKSAELTTGAAG